MSKGKHRDCSLDILVMQVLVSQSPAFKLLAETHLFDLKENLLYGIFYVGKLIIKDNSKSSRSSYYMKLLYTKDLVDVVLKKTLEVWKMFISILSVGGFGTMDMDRTRKNKFGKLLVENMLLSVWSNTEDGLQTQLVHYKSNYNPFISFISRIWSQVNEHSTFHPVMVDFFSPEFLKDLKKNTNIQSSIETLKELESITHEWLLEGALLAALTVKVSYVMT